MMSSLSVVLIAKTIVGRDQEVPVLLSALNNPAQLLLSRPS